MNPTDVFTTMLHGVDTLDWGTVLSSFADRVDIDYTELWGGEPDTLPIDALVTDWTELATGFDATQHLTGPLIMTHQDDERVECATTFRAYHHLIEESGASTWMVSGRYAIRLQRDADRWRIGAITLHLAYEEGDRRLVEAARQRSVAGVGGRTSLLV